MKITESFHDGPLRIDHLRHEGLAVLPGRAAWPCCLAVLDIEGG
jgi:hypothetical protein